MKRNFSQSLQGYVIFRLSQLLQQRRDDAANSSLPILVTINDPLKGEGSLQVSDQILNELASSVLKHFADSEFVRKDLPSTEEISLIECSTVRSVCRVLKDAIQLVAEEPEVTKVAF